MKRCKCKCRCPREKAEFERHLFRNYARRSEFLQKFLIISVCLFLVSELQRMATNTIQIMCLFRKSKLLQIILWLIALATYANMSVLQVCPRIKDLSLTKF